MAETDPQHDQPHEQPHAGQSQARQSQSGQSGGAEARQAAAGSPSRAGGNSGNRPYLVPAASALAGVAVILVAVAMGQAVSIGSVLGVLLLLSALVRFEIARRS